MNSASGQAAARNGTAKVVAGISRQQMAFARAWAEGVDVALAYHRYVQAEGHADARRARRTLQQVLDALRALARARGRQDIAVLLRRDPEAISDPTGSTPSIDEFRARQPEDFYTEAELLALYESQHGRVSAGSAARRRQRLRARLVEALQWLDRQGAVLHPQPGDAVAGWLDERVAARLAVVGIRRLDELMFWLRRHGRRWHVGIPRLGTVGAARILRWLDAHEDSLGPLPEALRRGLLGGDASPPVPSALPARFGIVPLERLQLPPGLSSAAVSTGVQSGSQRAPSAGCRIAATDDVQAIRAWLGARARAAHTARAYRKEAERLLLWSTVLRGKPMSSLDAQDCAAYRAFLAAPPAAWCGPRHSSRQSADWRPFEGPLSPRSAATAVAILSAMFDWLRRECYLVGNPWEAPASPAEAPAGVDSRTALSPEEWRLVLDWLAARPPSPAQRRLAAILWLACGAGLTPSELRAARWGWLRGGGAAPSGWLRDGAAPSGLGVRSDRVEPSGWTLSVPSGPGLRPRELPLAAEVAEALLGHLGDQRASDSTVAAQAHTQSHTQSHTQPHTQSLTPAATRSTSHAASATASAADGAPQHHDDDRPLVSRLDRPAPLSATRLYKVVAAAFAACSRNGWARESGLVERVRQMSLRGLRHSHAEHAVEQGIGFAALQARLGHASPAATAAVWRAAAARRGPTS